MATPQTKSDMTTTATKSELSRALKIHRAQLDTFLAKPGAPSPDAKKRYDTKAVAAWIAESRGTGSADSLKAARLIDVVGAKECVAEHSISPSGPIAANRHLMPQHRDALKP